MFGFEKGSLDKVNKKLLEKINPLFKTIVHSKKEEPISRSACDAEEQMIFDSLGKEYNIEAQEATGRTHMGMYDDWNNGEDKDNCSVRKRMLFRKFEEKRGMIYRVISGTPEHQAAMAAETERLSGSRAEEAARLEEMADDEREEALAAEVERLTGVFNESNERGVAALKDFEARERANFPTPSGELQKLIKQRRDNIIVIVEVQTGPDGAEIGSEDDINAMMDETFASMIEDNGAAMAAAAETGILPKNGMDTMPQCARMEPGCSFESDNGEFKLTMQSDGNLVLYKTDGAEALWASGTGGNEGAVAVLQSDHHFVVYNADNEAVWSTNVFGKGEDPCYVCMQDDGNFVQYDATGAPMWDTSTHGGEARIELNSGEVNIDME